VAQPQVYNKQLVAISCDEKTHELVRFNAKNALNQVLPYKIKKIYKYIYIYIYIYIYFIFNCVLFEKLVLNIIKLLHKLDGDRLMTPHL
jgi:hypothetical protein